jgi:hypothetical protein
MQAYKFRHLLWYLIGSMDTGKYDSVSFQEVYKHTSDRTIKDFLESRFGRDLDLSIMEPADWRDLSEIFWNLANAVDARRKFGVENKGVCLLMAYTLEGMQQAAREEVAVA